MSNRAVGVFLAQQRHRKQVARVGSCFLCQGFDPRYFSKVISMLELEREAARLVSEAIFLSF